MKKITNFDVYLRKKYKEKYQKNNCSKKYNNELKEIVKSCEFDIGLYKSLDRKNKKQQLEKVINTKIKLIKETKKMINLIKEDTNV